MEQSNEAELTGRKGGGLIGTGPDLAPPHSLLQADWEGGPTFGQWIEVMRCQFS